MISLKFGWIICVLSLIVSVVVYLAIQEGSTLPVFGGVQFDPDTTETVWRGLFIPVAIMIVSLALFSALKWIEPRRDHLKKSLPARDGFAMAAVLMMLIVQAGVIAALLGIEISKTQLVLLAAGIGMVVMGNYMGKTRSNFFIGFQTPWTLSNEDNWRKTHRLGGKLFMFSGVVMVLMSWMLNEVDMTNIILTGIILPIVIPVIYSWWIWHKAQPSNEKLRTIGDE